MKILHVPQAYWPVVGGGEVLATEVSEKLVERGHEVHVLTGNVPGTWAYGKDMLITAGLDAPAREERGGVHVERFPYLRIDPRLGRGLYAWPIPMRAQIRRRLRRRSRRGFLEAIEHAVAALRPDAVLTMSHFNPNVVAVGEARRRRPFPLVFSPQLHHDAPGWRPDVVRSVVERSDVVASNTNYEAGLLAAEYGAAPDRIVVTGCGVNGTAEIAPWPRRPRVLFVGRKVVHKGLDLLLDAMRLVWEKAEDAEVVLAGARVPETEEVEALVAGLPSSLARRVVDRTDVTEAEKEALIRESTCLVLPSRHESFGIVLLEAWRHGTPVVTLDRPVLREIVRHDETGLLADDTEPASMAEAILRYLQDARLAEAHGRAGHAEVAARHTWSHVAERYERALRLAVEVAR